MQSKTGKKKAFASKAMDKKAEYLPALSCLSLIFIIMKPLKKREQGENAGGERT